jgi:subtilisin-like proprotein convertase family protein
MKKLIAPLFFLFVLSIKAQTFNGSTGKIKNNGVETYFNLTAAGLPSQIDSIFGIEEVCININHPKVEQLFVSLRSPSGNTVELSDAYSCHGANYLNTCFNNSVAAPISLGTVPYSGSYKPIGYLGRFNTGQPANGVWTLIVKDYVAFVDSGNVISWSIKFGNSPSHPVIFKSSNLPIVIINTNNQNIGDTKIMVGLGIIYNGVGQRNNLTDPCNNFNAKALIHIRGNSTRYFEKKSFSLETHDISGIKLKASILGMPLESDWDLVAPYQDKSLLRIPLGYTLFQEMGHYAARYKMVELVVNNEYRGVYALMEKPKQGKDRINVSKLTVADNSVPYLTGGYIIKIDRTNAPGWNSLLAGSAPNNKHFFYAYDYPKDSVITPQQKTYIKAYLDTVETVINSPSFSNPLTGYQKYIETGSFVDYFILSELSRNVDAYRLATFLYKDNISKSGKLQIGPVWDFGIAFHNCNYSDAFLPNGWEYQIPDTVNPAPTWWGRFFQDSNFVDKLYCRWHELRQNVLSINRLNNFLDSSANVLNESQHRNFIQWPVMGAYVWPNPQNQATASYQNEINDIKTWLANRIAWMDGIIAGHCTTVGIKENSPDNADDLTVYPNPFYSTVTFAINLSKNALVSLKIFDATGKEVVQLINEYKSFGEMKIIYDRKQSESGIYLYQLKINDVVKTGKIILQ